MLSLYKEQVKLLVALDSVIFGFDGETLKILLVKRGIETDKDTWSLMGGWLKSDESLDNAAERIVHELTGLNNVYLEQITVMGEPNRDPVERTVSVIYYALINVADYNEQISEKYNAKWFSLEEMPNMLYDHDKIVKLASDKLKYKAAFHPVGLELLPKKFTIPQFQILYEAIYGTTIDKRNFSRNILSTGLLVKLEEKQRGFSKKGAYYYEINQENYKKTGESFVKFIPNIEPHI
ncbi:MAG: NUDIX hydrolase [Pseudarcicella sp.]|nr:NUDIX hydrolase [Pseudarcicella sp.]MBP6410256.1 NUDIX hydrolase [Pseudarcicella sp.]